MTATELYQTDPEFQALIQCWITDKRCPIPMADYLRERGLEGQAEAAEWAAWEIKHVKYMGINNEEKIEACYTFVRYEADESWWWVEPAGGYLPDNNIPIVLIPSTGTGLVFYGKPEDTVPEALLWLLDRWAEVAAQGFELPKAKVGVLC